MDNNVTMNHRNSHVFITLLLVFMTSLFFVDWHGGVMHTGGGAILRQIGSGLVNIDLRASVLLTALHASLETAIYALISVSTAIVFGLILGVLASGLVIKNQSVVVAFRGFLGWFRAVHELVWAWLFVAAVGFNPLGAIIALTIAYAGDLGKIYADFLIEVDQRKINALKASGASQLECLLYGYFPSAFPDMMSYTVYRLECAIRSTTVLSFVGLGGVGSYVILTVQDLAYEQMWVYVICLILMVIGMNRLGDLFQQQMMLGVSKRRRALVVLLLSIIGSWIYIIFVDQATIQELLKYSNADYIKVFFGRLFGLDSTQPAFFDWTMWQEAGRLSLETILMSVVALGLAVIPLFIWLILGSWHIFAQMRGEHSWMRQLIYGLQRGLFLVTRSVPELLWAIILVFIVKPGILPGAVALALHNFGVLGHLTIQLIKNMDQRALNHLQTNGADNKLIFVYGILPQLIPQFLNYILFRWEHIIRASMIVGFVGAGGLGQAFRLAMSYQNYSEVMLYIMCYILLVYVTDILSKYARDYIRVRGQVE
ncbi:PhnE/PtxC family ABC transporter permease [Dolosigranulum pigrum]|jgi:probable permease of ABC transporter|uniref:PhnE/PtxC family ABC transporter permease n=1 Tax=Dolosigranulum pigrum TaxID=29394 RepID=UPI002432D1AD|nr:ABC transporter permease subunit [Dolosigranulum pigrum]